MKAAVLSGKGGAGKTFIAVNLAASVPGSQYIDCDVEEPNGRLFLKPERTKQSDVCTKLPAFDASKCVGCKECVAFCRFHALIYIKEKPKVFSEICHSCGGCMLVCPQSAITETTKKTGVVEEGSRGKTKVITGILNPGEASGVPVIRQALETGSSYEGLTVIDCPPGSACSVMESIKDADYCLLAAEPTAFGFHNFKMVHRLCTLLEKPCGVVINKIEQPYEPLEAYCREHDLPVLLRIPYEKKIAQAIAEGQLPVELDSRYRQMFAELVWQIQGTKVENPFGIVSSQICAAGAQICSTTPAPWGRK